MTEEFERQVAEAVGSLRRRYEGLLREAGTGSLVSAWTVTGSWLRWQVEIEDVLEPDLDVEILSEVLVVRGLRGTLRAEVGVALLPVPDPFDASRPVIRTHGDLLEVRLRRRRAREAR